MVTSSAHSTRAPARSATIGKANERLVLDDLLRHGPRTRTQLKRATGMAQPTVSAVLERLSARGLVKSESKEDSSVRGPNAELFELDGSRAHVGVLRLSPDRLRLAVVDLAGDLRAEHEERLCHPDAPAAECADALRVALATARLDEEDVASVLVGVPGPVHPETREPLFVAERPTWGRHIKSELEVALGRPLQFENQLNLAGLAEFRHRRASGWSSMCLLSVGPAAGAAFVLHDRLWPGASGGAGEVAFAPVSDRVAETFESELDGVTDPDQIARTVARLAAMIVAVIDPGSIVLTGTAVSTDPAAFVHRVEERYQAVSHWPVEFSASTVEGDAVLAGGAAIALEEQRNAIWGVPLLR